MELVLAPQLAPQQALGVSPMLVASAQMLELGLDEIAETVRRELEENPALVRVERPACAGCGSQREPGRGCPRCRRSAPPREHTVALDRAATLAQPRSDADALLAELRLALPADDHTVAETILACLDGRGYLTVAPERIAGWLAVEPARVEQVLAEVRALGPAGIGARDLRECLLLQLDRMQGSPELVRAVVADHLQALADGSYGAIARALGVGREEIVRARDFIRQALHPGPGFSRSPDGASHPQAPDAIVEAHAGRLRVRLTEQERFSVSVCPQYLQLGERGSAAERRHAGERAKAAREFALRLEERWATITRVLCRALEHQAEWVLRGGARRELTRAQIARELSLHESTVSRAVRDRCMQLPTGRVVAIAELFVRGDERREALRKVLAEEQRALSDAELVDALAARGHTLARRTVAKYRSQLGEPRFTMR